MAFKSRWDESISRLSKKTGCRNAFHVSHVFNRFSHVMLQYMNSSALKEHPVTLAWKLVRPPVSFNNLSPLVMTSSIASVRSKIVCFHITVKLSALFSLLFENKD